MASIRTERLTKRFGRTTALENLDLEIEEGEVFGFLGPNGAGKTTTIRLLLGLLRPTSGRAIVLGHDCRREAVEVHRDVAYVPGDFEVWPWLTGEETLDFIARIHGNVDAEYRDELIAIFDFDPTKKGRSYSKGNRQKIAVIAAFASRAKLLILDEPTAGLDPLMNIAFRKCVSEASRRGQTVFLSSHMLSDVEVICERVGILRDGRLIEIGEIDQMRHLAARTVEVTFGGEPPDLSRVEGVSGASRDDRTVRCHVTGDVGPLIAALAGSGVVDLTSEEASLEEIFLAHYGRDADGAAGVDARSRASAGGD